MRAKVNKEKKRRGKTRKKRIERKSSKVEDKEAANGRKERAGQSGRERETVRETEKD